MKKAAFVLVSLLITISLVAQGNSKKAPGHQKKGKHDEKITVKPFIKFDEDKDEHHDKHHDDDHDNGNGHAYGRHKNGMTGREFGQHRAEEARSKHRPKNDREADERIVIFKRENIGLIDIIKDKFRQAREKLEGLLKGDKITKKEYLAKSLILNSLDGRRSKIELRVSL